MDSVGLVSLDILSATPAVLATAADVVPGPRITATVVEAVPEDPSDLTSTKGEAEAILFVADATAKGIDIVAESIKNEGGPDAVSLRVAEQYVDAFGKLAQKNNTLILPANVSSQSSFIAQAMTIYDKLQTAKKK